MSSSDETDIERRTEGQIQRHTEGHFERSEEHIDEHRAALSSHCYRMLGSLADADDAVQETMLRAWKSLADFQGRAGLRTWLFRIATNVCLTALSRRDARHLPFDEGEANDFEGSLFQRPASYWVEPFPDSIALSGQSDPARRAVLRQSTRLAFVAALQHLSPRQRAVLLLRDVVGFSAAEAAECLEISVASVNSALQRARVALPSQAMPTEEAQLGEQQLELLARYQAAFERYDLDSLVALLREDATHCMPPYALWLRGPATIHRWMAEQGAGCRGSKLFPTWANGCPAFAQYRQDPAGGPRRAWALVVLELSDDRISTVHNFLDTEALFPVFGFAAELSGASAG